MSFDELPVTGITEYQAAQKVQDFLDERAGSGVLIAKGFTGLSLSEGRLTAWWSSEALGDEKSEVVLEVQPFENLAAFIGTPLAFDSEEGRQIRQHVSSVEVIGPFGVGVMTTRELYEQAVGGVEN